MLVGRTSECAFIDATLTAARAGESRSVVIRGDAGVGKTTLLRYAADRAAGSLVLAARGVESESELPFSGLSDLLHPLIGRLSELPGPQAAALAGALSIGPPVAGDRFAVCAATLSLLSAAAGEGTVLVLLDDVQWMDGSSVEAFTFTARRLRAEGIAMLFALRDSDGVPAHLRGMPDFPLSGLAERDAAALLTAHASGPVAPGVAARIAAATGGNPLALVELPRVLTGGQLAGEEPIKDPLPVGRTVEQVFLDRVNRLPTEVGRALVVAAAADTSALADVVTALTALGGTLVDLEAAETAGLISLDEGRISFEHPLVRSAVYHGASAAARRAAHRALADAVPAATQRRPWHLAAAASGPDERIAASLVTAAEVAVTRRSYTTACTALEQAARLTAAPEPRARRLLDAADAAQTAGRIDKAIILLDRALGTSADPTLRAAIQHLRGRILTWRGAPTLARELLVQEAAAIEAIAPERAAAMLSGATLPCIVVGDPVAARAAAERAVRLGRRVGSPELASAATLLLILALVVRGRTRLAERLLNGCDGAVDRMDILATEQPVLITALCHMGLERFDEARELAVRAVGAARAASAIGLLPFQLSWLSQIDFRTGNWAAAYAGADDALRLAEETGWLTEIPNALIALAQVEAGQGREEDCRAHVGAALGLAEGVGAVAVELRALSVLGALEVALGRPAAALVPLRRAVRMAEERSLREISATDAVADLVEAHMRLGHESEAAAALRVLDGLARETGLPSVRARAARCRGMLARGTAGDAHFLAALAAHDEVTMPFERARTELCYGEALRRNRQRAAAARWLRAAITVFERLGAEPWVRRAAAELRACGEQARRRDQPASRQLTPQELQVALEVAKGATNQATATALFLSTKTVEFHLGNVYRKLGIRSRARLAYLFATDRGLNDAAS